MNSKISHQKRDVFGLLRPELIYLHLRLLLDYALKDWLFDCCVFSLFLLVKLFWRLTCGFCVEFPDFFMIFKIIILNAVRCQKCLPITNGLISRSYFHDNPWSSSESFKSKEHWTLAFLPAITGSVVSVTVISLALRVATSDSRICTAIISFSYSNFSNFSWYFHGAARR